MSAKVQNIRVYIVSTHDTIVPVVPVDNSNHFFCIYANGLLYAYTASMSLSWYIYVVYTRQINKYYQENTLINVRK